MRLIEFIRNISLDEGVKLNKGDAAMVADAFVMGFEIEFYYTGATTFVDEMTYGEFENLLDDPKPDEYYIEDLCEQISAHAEKFFYLYKQAAGTVGNTSQEFIDRLEEGKKQHDDEDGDMNDDDWQTYCSALFNDTFYDFKAAFYAYYKVIDSNNERYWDDIWEDEPDYNDDGRAYVNSATTMDWYELADSISDDLSRFSIYPNITDENGRYQDEDDEDYDDEDEEEDEEYSSVHSDVTATTDWVLKPDGSLGNYLGGAELSSPIFDYDMGLKQMEKAFKFIKQYARTTSNTGLHISVSFKDKSKLESMDWVKAALFMGDEHTLKKFNRTSNNYAIPHIERLRREIKSRMGDEIRDVPALIRSEGFQKLAHSLQDAVDKEKYRSFNIENLVSQNGRIEFRIWGNKNYENRIDEITRDLTSFCKTLVIASNPNAMRQEYIKKLTNVLSVESKGIERNDEHARVLLKDVQYSDSEIRVIMSYKNNELISNMAHLTRDLVRLYILLSLAGNLREIQSKIKTDTQKKTFEYLYRLVQKRIAALDSIDLAGQARSSSEYINSDREEMDYFLQMISSAPQLHAALTAVIDELGMIKNLISAVPYVDRNMANYMNREMNTIITYSSGNSYDSAGRFNHMTSYFLTRVIQSGDTPEVKAANIQKYAQLMIGFINTVMKDKEQSVKYFTEYLKNNSRDPYEAE